MEGIHRIDSRACRFTADAVEDQPDVIEHYGVLEVFPIEKILIVAFVELRLGADFMPDEETAQEDMGWVLQQPEDRLAITGSAIVARNQYAAVKKCPGKAISHTFAP